MGAAAPQDDIRLFVRLINRIGMGLGQTKNEVRSRAPSDHAIGRALLETATALDVIGEPRYGNGLAIIAVHAAIACTDALTIASGQVKSVDGDHTRAAEVRVHARGTVPSRSTSGG